MVFLTCGVWTCGIFDMCYFCHVEVVTCGSVTCGIFDMWYL